MIPKKLHYIWLGGKELPEMVQKCINSWKQFCPDYEIIKWDESNLDLDCCEYCREAYDNKKYAFASDVLRFKTIYEQGGIYLDVDVMLYKPLDDLLNLEAFMGFEEPGIINPGLIFGAQKGNEDIKTLYYSYMTRHFLINGKIDYKTICDVTSTYLNKFGLTSENKIQKINSITIFPIEYFCPYNYKTKKLNKTDNSYSVHLYLASWVPKQTFVTKIKNRLKGLLKNILKFFMGKEKFEKFLEKRRKKNK